METRNKIISLEVAPEVEERLQAVADEKGVSVQDLCRSAIDDALDKFSQDADKAAKPHFNIEALIALQKQTFGDRVLPTDSAEIIREQRELRTRHLESLAWPDSS